jgi:hyaluronoglucosaminidase
VEVSPDTGLSDAPDGDGHRTEPDSDAAADDARDDSVTPWEGWTVAELLVRAPSEGRTAPAPLPPARARWLAGAALPVTLPLTIAPEPQQEWPAGVRDEIERLMETGLLPGWQLGAAGDEGALILHVGDLAVLEASGEEDFAAPFAPGAEGYLLAVRGEVGNGEDGRVRVAIFARAPEGLSYALRRLATLVEPTQDGAHSISETTLVDWPATPLRAVFEGFYGPPWEHQARLDMLRFTAEVWMNALVIGAKDDPFNRLLWQNPLPPNELARIDELVAAARAHRVRLCYQVSPGFGVEYGLEAHRDAILARFRTFLAHGVDCLVLAFDDVPKDLRGGDPDTYESYAAAQLDFSSFIFETIAQELPPGGTLAFVPNDYWTRATDDSDDLALIAAGLDPAIEIAWTGAEICSAHVTAEDGAEIREILGRPSLFGDNYLVKDGGRWDGNLVLTPLSGRDPALMEEVSGVAFNLTPLPYASMLPLRTAAHWSWAPETYDAVTALHDAVVAHAGAHSDALHMLIGFCGLMCPSDEVPDPPLAGLARAFAGNPHGPDAPNQVAHLREELIAPVLGLAEAFDALASGRELSE